MKIIIYEDDAKYLLSNKNLKVGDKVFPMTSGETVDGKYYVNKIYSNEDAFHCLACTGWPSEPHTIKDLKHNGGTYKPYEVHTSHGYGPKEKYFKIIEIIKWKN